MCILLHDNFLFLHFYRLDLIVVVIEGAKKYHDSPSNILCQLENIDQNVSQNSSNDYPKSLLALVLQKDNTVLWETLVLSNTIDFTSTDM